VSQINKLVQGSSEESYSYYMPSLWNPLERDSRSVNSGAHKLRSNFFTWGLSSWNKKYEDEPEDGNLMTFN